MERWPRNFDLNYEIVKTREYSYFKNNFEYTPPGWVNLDHKWYPLGFRVTTMDNKSLGLRNNPTIFTYSKGNWVLETKPLISERTDNGGIWSGASLSSAHKTQSYCLNRKENPFETKIYYAALYNPIFANSYGVKSEGLMILDEVKS
jgi:hypothetical protein